MCMGPMIKWRNHEHHWDAHSMHMSNQRTATCGTHNQKQGSTCAHPWSTTNVLGKFKGLNYKNKSNVDNQYSAIQTPIHTKYQNLTWIACGGSITATSNSTKRQLSGRQQDSRCINLGQLAVFKNSKRKNEQLKAKEQQYKLQIHPSARKCTPPRVEKVRPRVEEVSPRVEMAAPRKETTHTSKNGNSWTPISKPNYINQDQEEK